MTDDRMDTRLRGAGERWRAAQDSAEDNPPDEIPVQPRTHAGRVSRRAATLVSVAAVAAVALAAGIWLVLRPNGAPQSAAAARLAGTNWVLAHVVGRGWLNPWYRVPAHLQGTLRLTIKDGRIVGDDGCNTFSGPVDVSGGNLRIHDLAVTAAACTGSRQMAIEKYFDGSVRWSISGDTLTITKDGVGTLTYRTPTPGSPEDLIGRTWELDGVENPTGDFGWYSYSSAPPTISAHFVPVSGSSLFISPDGVLIADVRCGKFTARVRVGSRRLTVSRRSFIPHSCPALVQRNRVVEDPASRVVRRALTGTLAWAIDGGVLKIVKPKGPWLQYRAQTTEPAPSYSGTAMPLSISPSATASPVTAADLVDRNWHLSGLKEKASGSTLGIAFSGGVPTLRITHSGSLVAGLGTCQSYRGRVTLHDTSLTVVSRHVDGGLCPALPKTETRGDPVPGLLGRLLTGTVAWRISGHVLTVSSHHIAVQYTDQPPARGPSATATPLRPADERPAVSAAPTR